MGRRISDDSESRFAWPIAAGAQQSQKQHRIATHTCGSCDVIDYPAMKKRPHKISTMQSHRQRFGSQALAQAQMQARGTNRRARTG